LSSDSVGEHEHGDEDTTVPAPGVPPEEHLRPDGRTLELGSAATARGRATAPPAPADMDGIVDPDDSPDPAEAPVMIRRQLRDRKTGPVRRFVLYASGVDTRVLWYAPIDETEFVVQGTLVVLTALVACVSGLAASSFLIAGLLEFTAATIGVGLGWGLLIFFFDRALVSGSFNPYRFTRREIEGLRDAPDGSVWAHVVGAATEGRRAVWRRVGEIVRVMLVASLRIALALATSFIAAEMVLFLVFQPEISQRAAYIEQQTQAQRIAAIQADYKTEAAKRAAQRDQLTGASDPDVARLRAQSQTLTTQLANGRKDLGILQAAAAAEENGLPYTGRLSDGTTVTTTGRSGVGPSTRSLSERRDTQKALVAGWAAALARTNAALDAKLAQIEKTNAPALHALDVLDNQAAANEQAQIAAATVSTSAVKGLLVRQAALNQLINDRNPDTVAPDPVAKCSNVFCSLRNWLLPPTPMGPIVIAYRVIFFVIEILPITYKVITSLRRRRPYDAVKAALEEAAIADSIRLADRHLHEAAAEMAARAHLRRSRAAQMLESERISQRR